MGESRILDIIQKLEIGNSDVEKGQISDMVMFLLRNRKKLYNTRDFGNTLDFRNKIIEKAQNQN